MSVSYLLYTISILQSTPWVEFTYAIFHIKVSSIYVEYNHMFLLTPWTEQSNLLAWDRGFMLFYARSSGLNRFQC